MGKTLEDLLRTGQHDEALQRIQSGELDPSSAPSGLHHAAGLDNPELLRRLLAAGSDPDHPSKPRPIEAAVSKGHLANVEALLAAGADPNTGQILMRAIEEGHDEMAARLVAGGARPVGYRESPLVHAVWRNLSRTLRAMIEAGYDVDDRATLDLDPAPAAGQIQEPSEHMEKDLADYMSKYQAIVAEEEGAAKAGDVSRIYDNAPAVVVASGEGHRNLLELLVTSGANLSAADDLGLTPWAAAERGGHHELARWIETVGGTRQLVFSATEILLRAAEQGNLEIARRALADGAEANARDQRKRSFGRTPLLLAILGGPDCDHRHAEMVQLLLESGADPELRDRPDGQKAQGVFGQAATAEVFKFPHVVYGHTPLALASIFGRVDCADILIKAGADVSSVDDLGYACADQAVINNQAEVLGLLLAAGVDPSHKGPAGPLLTRAAANGHFPCVSLLLQAGADPGTSHLGQTALHHAAMAQDGDSILALLEAGADPNCRNGDGETALQLALDYGDTEGEGSSLNEDESQTIFVDGKMLAHLTSVTTVALKLPEDEGQDDDDWDDVEDRDEDEDDDDIPELDVPQLESSLQVHYAKRAARDRLAAAALSTEVRAIADELGQRCGSTPQEMVDGQGFTLHVQPGSLLARDPLNIEALQAEYRPQGVLIFGHGSPHHQNQLHLMPTTDPLEAIAAVGCAGPSCDVSGGQVIEFFRVHPAVITDLRHDTVVGRFDPLPNDLRQLAIEVFSLCPDAVYQGGGSLNALVLSLAAAGQFHLCWD